MNFSELFLYMLTKRKKEDAIQSAVNNPLIQKDNDLIIIYDGKNLVPKNEKLYAKVNPKYN